MTRLTLAKKNIGTDSVEIKDKSKESKRNTDGNAKLQDKSKMNTKNVNNSVKTTKSKNIADRLYQINFV